MWQKFISRKLFAAVAAFITVNVLPNIPADQRARFSGLIAAAYVWLRHRGRVGSTGVGSQGEAPPAEPPLIIEPTEPIVVSDESSVDG